VHRPTSDHAPAGATLTAAAADGVAHWTTLPPSPVWAAPRPEPGSGGRAPSSSGASALPPPVADAVSFAAAAFPATVAAATVAAASTSGSGVRQLPRLPPVRRPPPPPPLAISVVPAQWPAAASPTALDRPATPVVTARGLSLDFQPSPSSPSLAAMTAHHANPLFESETAGAGGGWAPPAGAAAPDASAGSGALISVRASRLAAQLALQGQPAPGSTDRFVGVALMRQPQRPALPAPVAEGTTEDGEPSAPPLPAILFLEQPDGSLALIAPDGPPPLQRRLSELSAALAARPARGGDAQRRLLLRDAARMLQAAEEGPRDAADAALVAALARADAELAAALARADVGGELADGADGQMLLSDAALQRALAAGDAGPPPSMYE